MYETTVGYPTPADNDAEGTSRVPRTACYTHECCQQSGPDGFGKGAHAGSRTRVTSMGGLYDAATLRALLTSSDRQSPFISEASPLSNRKREGRGNGDRASVAAHCERQRFNTCEACEGPTRFAAKGSHRSATLLTADTLLHMLTRGHTRI